MLNIAYCSSCWDEFIQKTESHSTCPKKECRHKFAEWKRYSKHHIAQDEMHKRIANNKNSERTRTTVVKTAIIHEMKAEYGYILCQRCNIQTREIELHHIAYRSEVPWHPQKHSKANSILCCHDCHEFFHKKKSNRNYLVKERILWEVFPELFRKEFYE